ncbi:hypothetical protein SFRURICE_008737 [Spodoptera frugiperda]|nr:hypothetical protein SFRURICE_008737 [Spodoptera frugiperda]
MYLFQTKNKTFVYIGQLMCGYGIGWSAPALALLQNPEKTILETPITVEQASWIVSSSFVGFLTGPYVSGYLCNAIGRKPCLYVGGVFIGLGFMILALAKHIAVMYVGRAVVGFGIGVLFVTNLVYLGELASIRNRGTLLTLTGFSSTCGTLIAYSVGPFVSYAAISWIAVGIAVGYVIGLFFIVPETAVYLVMATMELLTSLGRKDDIDDVVAKANEKPMSNKAQMAEMFTIKSNRKALFLIITLNILQQLSGINIVLSFSTTIFELTGSSMEPHISTIIVGVTQVGAASIAPLFVDRTGRRILMLISTAVCSISLFALGAYFFLFDNEYDIADDLQWMALASVVLYFIAYFSGFGIIPNTFIGEMFTDNCRGFGSTFTVTVGWVFGFGITAAFGYMLPGWGPSVTFWIFAGASVFACLFSAVFVPETKGKSIVHWPVIGWLQHGWTAPVLAELQSPDQTVLDSPLTVGQGSWVVSFIFVGTITGPYVSGYLCNVIGRKPCLYIGGVFITLGFMILALANQLAMLYAGRIIMGFGNGMLFVTNLVYLGELASTNVRGTLLTLTGFSSTMGTLIAYVVGPYVSYAALGWLAVAIGSVFLVTLFFFVPETAVYFVMAGKKDEAMELLTSLGRKDDIDDVVAKANEKPMSNKDQMAEMFTIKSNRKATFIIIVLNIFQQASGIIAVISFATTIFELTGSSMEPHISTIIVGVTQVAAGSIAPLFVDKTGRKILLLISTAACSLSLIALGVYFFLYDNGYEIADDLQWMALVSLVLYFIAYFSGTGFSSTFTVTVGWVFGFGVSAAFGYMLPAWGPAVTFWIFAGACALAFFFSAIFVPETKGKSLLEIQELLSK